MNSENISAFGSVTPASPSPTFTSLTNNTSGTLPATGDSTGHSVSSTPRPPLPARVSSASSTPLNPNADNKHSASLKPIKPEQAVELTSTVNDAVEVILGSNAAAGHEVEFEGDEKEEQSKVTLKEVKDNDLQGLKDEMKKNTGIWAWVKDNWALIAAAVCVVAVVATLSIFSFGVFPMALGALLAVSGSFTALNLGFTFIDAMLAPATGRMSDLRDQMNRELATPAKISSYNDKVSKRLECFKPRDPAKPIDKSALAKWKARPDVWYTLSGKELDDTHNRLHSVKEGMLAKYKGKNLANNLSELQKLIDDPTSKLEIADRDRIDEYQKQVNEARQTQRTNEKEFMNKLGLEPRTDEELKKDGITDELREPPQQASPPSTTPQSPTGQKIQLKQTPP